MHKGKAVPVGTLKAYGERMVQVHMFCNRADDGVSSFTLVTLPPMKGPVAPIPHEGAWDP
jgi:hypothetical protein